MRNLRFAAIFLLFTTAAVAASIPAPSDFLGMKVGADKTLADYRQIVSYFRALAAASPRVEIEDLGKTTLGEDMIMAVISSEANLKNKARLQQIAHRLADPSGLTDEQLNALVKEGKTFVLVTCNIHSTEIASSQMAMEWAHDLAAANDPETKRRLDNVVLLLVPSLNPDGQIIVTDWYRKNLGTRYEGGRLPWLYHHYVGHDNNRDWFMLTQAETRNLTRAVYHEWMPQVFVDEHQMGTDGPRMFIPPFADPLDPTVHPLIWREANLIGSNMAFRLEQQNKAGMIYGFSFDAYWLGGTRNTGWWKNITGLLLETASARIATPITIEPSELRGGQKGLIDYKATVNHPHPWEGGTWRMRDIMDYERIASDALLEIATERREDFLRDVAARARAAIAIAKPGEAYRVPKQQRDWPTAEFMLRMLSDHGVRIVRSQNGDAWIPMAQPYGKFVSEMLEPQRYPEVRLQAGKEILRPYDIATWTLPMMMGVTVEHSLLPRELANAAPATFGASDRFDKERVIAATSAQAAIAVNSALAKKQSVSLATVDGTPSFILGDNAPADAKKLRAPRVAIFKPWSASLDEGWTRWLLDTYGFAPDVVTTNDVRGVSGPPPFPPRPAPPAGAASSSHNATAAATGALATRFDAIILPDIDKEEIATGRRRVEEGGMKYADELPPEYRGGLEKDGAEALRTFVNTGGTLIAFGAASDYVIQEFNIPVRNALARTRPDEFSVPGSLVRLHVRTDHPVTFGMPSEVAAFIDHPIVFETTSPGLEMKRWVLATYPEDPRDILLSGWINGEEKLTRKAAAVAMTYGKGKIVLFAFRPQHRGQTHATFPMVFNAIYWSAE
ncbi:MAG TPA: M14 metallopeptidase family protein [Thermoanaerobaculia bacterium]|nr:M14 metallopeptidase family protein [Thermoanaerobaculia bacterium]